MKLIARLFAALMPKPRATTMVPAAMPLPAHLRRHFEAQDAGHFRP